MFVTVCDTPNRFESHKLLRQQRNGAAMLFMCAPCKNKLAYLKQRAICHILTAHDYTKECLYVTLVKPDLHWWLVTHGNFWWWFLSVNQKTANRQINVYSCHCEPRGCQRSHEIICWWSNWWKTATVLAFHSYLSSHIDEHQASGNLWCGFTTIASDHLSPIIFFINCRKLAMNKDRGKSKSSTMNATNTFDLRFHQ